MPDPAGRVEGWNLILINASPPQPRCARPIESCLVSRYLDSQARTWQTQPNLQRGALALVPAELWHTRPRREKSMIRHSSNTSESWKTLPWKKFRRDLFRLQKRVFKAVRDGNKRKAMSLQRLILKSQAARFLAIRQVSQLNAGKKTAGIDGKKSLTFAERFELEELLKAYSNNWKHQRLREIPIPKKDGSTRMLKIPTIADRGWQCLAKYAIEPAHEATFHARSYGFRPGVRFVG